MPCKMSIRDKIAEQFDEDVLLAHGFDRALLGIGRAANGLAIAVYCRNKCISVLREQGMTEWEAEEYFDYNVQSAYVGEQTPMFVERINK